MWRVLRLRPAGVSSSSLTGMAWMGRSAATIWCLRSATGGQGCLSRRSSARAMGPGFSGQWACALPLPGARSRSVGRRIHRDLYRHRPWAGQLTGMVVCRAAGHRNRSARPRRGQAAAQAALDPGGGLPRACRAGRASVDRAALGPRGGGCHRGGRETLMAPAHRRPGQSTPRAGCPANPIRGIDRTPSRSPALPPRPQRHRAGWLRVAGRPHSVPGLNDLLRQDPSEGLPPLLELAAPHGRTAKSAAPRSVSRRWPSHVLILAPGWARLPLGSGGR